MFNVIQRLDLLSSEAFSTLFMFCNAHRSGGRTELSAFVIDVSGFSAYYVEGSIPGAVFLWSGDTRLSHYEHSLFTERHHKLYNR
jgi:hypothetical protein